MLDCTILHLYTISALMSVTLTLNIIFSIISTSYVVLVDTTDPHSKQQHAVMQCVIVAACNSAVRV